MQFQPKRTNARARANDDEEEFLLLFPFVKRASVGPIFLFLFLSAFSCPRVRRRRREKRQTSHPIFAKNNRPMSNDSVQFFVVCSFVRCAAAALTWLFLRVRARRRTSKEKFIAVSSTRLDRIARVRSEQIEREKRTDGVDVDSNRKKKEKRFLFLLLKNHLKRFSRTSSSTWKLFEEVLS